MDFPFTFTHTTNSKDETMAFAARLAPHFTKGDLIALVGDLGAGKSVFARTQIRTILGDPEADVPSPTFTLVQEYKGKKFNVWHSDLYRLEDSSEVEELGFDEALAKSVLLVEWPDRLPDHFHENSLIVSIKTGDHIDQRVIRLMGNNVWKERLKTLKA